MKSPTILFLALVLSSAACGDDGNNGNEDALAEIGFATPAQTTTAFEEVEGIWEERGAADWSCLNTASDEVPTSTEIALTGSAIPPRSTAGRPATPASA